MESSAFDHLARRAGRSISRRAAGRLLAGAAALAGLAGTSGEAPEAGAQKRRVRGEHNIRGNKAIMCIDGETRRVPKKQRKKWLKRGATRGKCDACTPVCTPGVCGGADGCGGTCGCQSGAVCANGTCQACTVTCPPAQTPEECGVALGEAIAAGGNVYVCPGFYDNLYSISGDVAVYGAGDGTDQATSTILRALPDSRVILVEEDVTALFANLRVTGGNAAESSGGGIRIQESESTVTLENCTVAGNTTSSGGGGIRAYEGTTLIIRGCEISDNSSEFSGGGINSDATVTVTDTLITRNFAGSRGAGIYTDDGTVDLDPSVTITLNEAAVEGGGFYQEGGTINPNGAVITNNLPDNCEGDDPVTC